MAKRVTFQETGGPEVLTMESVEVPAPGEGEVRLRHEAIGVNFADTYFRSGTYPAPLPAGMGVSGAGVVTDVGKGVTGFAAGDRVTYTGSPLGAYSTERNIDTAHLIRLPDGVGTDVAAAATMRGLTSAYLLRRIWTLDQGDTVLLTAAAGGVGQIFGQWAAHLGINVIGTVSTAEKADIALERGTWKAVNHREEDVAARVRDLTGGEGVPVAFDSIGADSFHTSIASLKRRGLLVCFGTAAGPIPPIDAMQLAIKGSVYVTRPALADYIADPQERASLAGELFELIEKDVISVDINQRYTLDEAVRAHADMESGRTTGSSVIEI